MFASGSFNALLTAGEFASLHLLRAYWLDAYAAGGRVGWRLAQVREGCRHHGAADRSPGAQHSRLSGASHPHVCCRCRCRRPAGRALVSARTNCEDILLNVVAAAAIRGSITRPGQQPAAVAGEAAAGEAAVAVAAAAGPEGSPGPERWPPHVVYVQPSRRLDISLLSGVGLSQGRGASEHLGALVAAGRRVGRRACAACTASLDSPSSRLRLPLLHPFFLPGEQPSGGGAWPSSLLSMATSCRRLCSRSRMLPGGGAPCAGCPSWAARTSDGRPSRPRVQLAPSPAPAPSPAGRRWECAA